MILGEADKRFPVGSKVLVTRFLGYPEDIRGIDEVTAKAYMLGGHVAVYLKERGAYHISNLEKANESQVMQVDIYINDDLHSTKDIHSSISLNNFDDIAFEIIRTRVNESYMDAEEVINGVTVSFKKDGKTLTERIVRAEIILDYKIENPFVNGI